MTSPTPDGKTSIEIARTAAACLSEVLRTLCIPHEILGHTTLTEQAEGMLKAGTIRADDLNDFSRLVPFRGYVFKTFEENAVPTSLFKRRP